MNGIDIDFLKNYLGKGFEVDCPINQPTHLEMFKSQEVIDGIRQLGINMDGQEAYSDVQSSLVTSTESLKNLTSSHLEDGYSVVLSMGEGVEMINLESGFSQKIESGHMADVIGVNEDGIIVSSYDGVWLCTYESMNIGVSEDTNGVVSIDSNASITAIKITETE